jgi:ATP-dependent Clp protease ATP-binding subunit ClpC
MDKEKEESVAGQDFERAAHIRDNAFKLRQKREEITRQWRDTTKESGGVVDEEVISETVSKMTGIPLTRLEKNEAERLLHMEDELHKTVVSQDEAIRTIARCVRRSRSGMKDPRRPVGSFMVLGPTGVGKTHLAKQLAKFMFGDEDALIQIDMSEYMEKHNVSRLVGAPPGYVGYEEGGQLTEKIRRRPYAVVLLDEIEKAHTDVFNMLLQIMEEGRLTDSFGRHVDFKNVILIMTSNIGSAVIKNQGSLGFGKQSEEKSYEDMKMQVLKEVDKQFKPEFLNRVDSVVVFSSLTVNDLKRIIDIEMSHVKDRMAQKGIALEIDDNAKEYVIKQGTNLDFGARPLKRALERFIEDPLSEEILRGSFEDKNCILVTVRDDHLYFDGQKREPVHAAEEV